MTAPLSSAGYSLLINRPIDNTALAAYMRCPKLFEYSMIQHRRHSGPPSPALAYGSAWHKALEIHYRWSPGMGLDRRTAVQLAVESSWQEHDRPDDFRTLQRVLLEYDKYVAKYGDPEAEAARGFGKTVGWPTQPLVEVATEVSWEGGAHPYSGKIDRVIDINGQLWVEDHKTASRDDPGFFRTFELKNQMQGYAFMARLITGQHIGGVRINRHVIRTRDSIHDRQTISFNREQLSDWGENYNRWINRIEADVEQSLSLRLDGQDTDRAFPRNFDACDAKYGMCSYVNVCSMPPRLRQAALEQDFPEVEPWEPLKVADDE